MRNDYYQLAKRYASKLHSELYKDIVHDAFLAHAILRNRNLFEEALPYIFRAVKLKYWEFLKYNRYRSNNEPYDDHLAETTTPFDWLAATETQKRIDGAIGMLNSNNSKPLTLHSIIELRQRGYRHNEIAKLLNIDRTLVTYYLKRLMSFINNPFTNKKEKGRSITLHTWEKLSDAEDYELQDFNEYFRLYRHKESLEYLLVKLPQKENPYINETFVQVGKPVRGRVHQQDHQ